jgi:hypothetical protein
MTNIRIMKTSLDIPDKELKDVLRFTKAKTKRGAIVTAVREYNRRKRMAALVSKHAGRSKTFMTMGELMRMRQAD